MDEMNALRRAAEIQSAHRTGEGSQHVPLGDWNFNEHNATAKCCKCGTSFELSVRDDRAVEYSVMYALFGAEVYCLGRSDRWA